jgi:hypothetical protein
MKKILLILALALSTHCHAQTVVQHEPCVVANPGTSLTCAYASPFPAGHLNILSIMSWNGIVSVTDDGGNTYVKGGSTSSAISWYTIATHSAQTITITQNTGAQPTAVVMAEISSISGFDVGVDTNGGVGCTSPITFPSITTTNASDVIFALVGAVSPGNLTTFTNGTGYTLIDQVVGGTPTPYTAAAAIEYKVVASTGSYAPTMNMSNCGYVYVADTDAFKISAAATASQIGAFGVGP